ncbi:MAG: MFS transporter [Aquamicrobium sp.]|uniref:MFS transporter n=1 Tax=Aquamicrobium sp. TaxID=1872579 RepID=UPI00349E87E3|nr:MFS transporter [Aquamicrobium sp.]
MTTIPSPGTRPPIAAAIRVGVMGMVVTMASQFYRNAHVVVAPDIMRDVGVSAQLLGMLSAGLFLTAALTQLPAGVLIDIHGPRRTIPLMLLTVVAGSLIFATAQSGAGLVVGRMLMGVGVAALGMASLVACARWFPPEQFGTVVGLVIGMSQVGNVVATYPMALVSDAIGWRNSYLIMTGVTLGLGLLSYLLIRDAPPDHPYHRRTPETIRSAFNGVVEVFRTPGVPRLLVMAFVAYAVVSCFLGLWIGPYLHDVHGLDTVQRGNVLFYFSVAMIVGNLSLGSLDRLVDSRKAVIMGGAVATILILVALVAWPQPPLLVASVLLTAIGFLAGYTIVIIVHGKGFYPDRLMGRGATLVNSAVLSGAATLQALTGLIAGFLAPGAIDLPVWVYQVIFATLAALLTLALAVYSTCPDKPRSGSHI